MGPLSTPCRPRRCSSRWPRRQPSIPSPPTPAWRVGRSTGTSFQTACRSSTRSGSPMSFSRAWRMIKPPERSTRQFWRSGRGSRSSGPRATMGRRATASYYKLKMSSESERRRYCVRPKSSAGHGCIRQGIPVRRSLSISPRRAIQASISGQPARAILPRFWKALPLLRRGCARWRAWWTTSFWTEPDKPFQERRWCGSSKTTARTLAKRGRTIKVDLA